MTEPTGTNVEAVDVLRQGARWLNVLLRHRWLLVLLPFAAGSISVLRTTSTARGYTSRSTFMTQSAPRPQASGLAAQFGLNLGTTSDPTQGPEFYTDLLRSRPILERTVKAEYTVERNGASERTTLLTLSGGDADRATGRLRGSIGTAISTKTGVVTLNVRSQTPSLAQQVNQELLRQLDEFNRGRRKSRIGSERQFTEARMKEVAAELRQAEDSLQEFYTRNRDFAGSPDKAFREDRMRREVQRRQQLYASLSQAFEQAKIDEIRDTPVITVLEEPIPPVLGDSRHTVDRALLSAALALLVAVIYAAAREWTKGTELRGIDELQELKALLVRFLSEVRHPIRGLRSFSWLGDRSKAS